MYKTNPIKIGLLLVIAIALTLGLSVSFQSLLAQWAPPSDAPPDGDMYKPIYATSTSDQKIDFQLPGSVLSVGGDLAVGGMSYFAATTTFANDLCFSDEFGNYDADTDCLSDWPAGGGSLPLGCEIKAVEVPGSGGHVYCDAGKVRTGGGCDPHAGGSITATYPINSDGWGCSGAAGPGYTTITARVVCCEGGGGSAGAGVGVIVCEQTGDCSGESSPITKTFSAADCGGTLPTADYTGTLSKLRACNGSVTANVLNAGETDGPGIMWHVVDGLNCCGNYVISAVYVREGAESSGSMIAGWPDAIMCEYGGEREILYLMINNDNTDRQTYGAVGHNEQTFIRFVKSTGDYFDAENSSYIYGFAGCENQNIADIPSFNFNGQSVTQAEAGDWVDLSDPLDYGNGDIRYSQKNGMIIASIRDSLGGTGQLIEGYLGTTDVLANMVKVAVDGATRDNDTDWTSISFPVRAGEYWRVTWPDAIDDRVIYFIPTNSGTDSTVWENDGTDSDIYYDQGGVGIGTNDPASGSFDLDVNGKIRMRSQTGASDSNDTVATKGYVDGSASLLSGSMCGFSLSLAATIHCDGHDPAVSCPSGYSRRLIAVMGAQGGNWYSCFKN